MNIKISILTPTLSNAGVMREHYDWFKRLCRPDIQLVMIDQNETPNLELKHISSYENLFTYAHSKTKGLSINRNKGIDFCLGDYIIFLDDDAVFYNDSLLDILSYLEVSKPDILCCGVVDNYGKLTSYTPKNKSSKIKVNLVEGKVNSNGLIVKRTLAEKIMLDEVMGVGADFGSNEEVDWVVRALFETTSAYYEPHLKVIHPPKPYTLEKSFSYGEGHGYFTRKLLFKYVGFRVKLLATRKISKLLIKLIIGCLFKTTRGQHNLMWSKGFWNGFKGK